MFKAVDVYVVSLDSVIVAIYPTRTSALAFCDGILFEHIEARILVTYNKDVIFANNIN